ncbi:MAG: hypothetical protein KAJ62_11320 [Desulfobacteraceae bacterium]|nr:hypothetical protein [Desulfobacteraceae bacterium]
MRINKQYIIFIIVFILLIISIIYRVKNPFVQEEVDTLTYTGTKTVKISLGQNKNKTGQSQSDTLVSRFLNRSEFSGEIVNDLFSFYNSSDYLKGKTEIWGPDGEITQEERINDEDIEDDPISKISKDLLSYKFYGTYKSQETRAIFLVKDKLVLVASIGDRIEGKYLIEELRDNYIRLKALDLNETIHIDMREFNNE